MARCETCGNDYANVISVSVAGGPAHTFDSFECAIHKLAPACANCGVRIVGHGVEHGDTYYCCAACARQAGVSGLADHA